jgi:hypothetical protein
MAPVGWGSLQHHTEMEFSFYYSNILWQTENFKFYAVNILKTAALMHNGQRKMQNVQMIANIQKDCGLYGRIDNYDYIFPYIPELMKIYQLQLPMSYQINVVSTDCIFYNLFNQLIGKFKYRNGNH